MRSNYERNRFRMIYGIVVFVFWLLITIESYVLCDGVVRKWVLPSVIAAICLLLLYKIAYHYIDKAYSEIEYVSGIMVDMLEGKKEPAQEEYKEGTVGILQSNFHQLVKALQDSRNKEKEEKIFLRDIISDISHQLKTPLASLTVFVDLLLEDKVQDKEQQKQILQEAEHQLTRMEWMVLAMLKLARIEAGAIQFDKRTCKLESVFARAVDGVKALASGRNQDIKITCDESMELLCDEDWLVEALINLLKNASDYSGAGKRIWIEAEQTPLYTRIYVKDEGVGIAEEELPNVFKRFYRVHQSVNPNSVGIGLSLTKSIVEGMEGSIKVRSKEGEYTWFIITFVKSK